MSFSNQNTEKILPKISSYTSKSNKPAITMNSGKKKSINKSTCFFWFLLL